MNLGGVTLRSQQGSAPFGGEQNGLNYAQELLVELFGAFSGRQYL